MWNNCSKRLVTIYDNKCITSQVSIIKYWLIPVWLPPAAAISFFFSYSMRARSIRSRFSSFRDLALTWLFSDGTWEAFVDFKASAMSVVKNVNNELSEYNYRSKNELALRLWHQSTVPGGKLWTFSRCVQITLRVSREREDELPAWLCVVGGRDNGATLWKVTQIYLQQRKWTLRHPTWDNQNIVWLGCI